MGVQAKDLGSSLAGQRGKKGFFNYSNRSTTSAKHFTTWKNTL